MHHPVFDQSGVPGVKCMFACCVLHFIQGVEKAAVQQLACEQGGVEQAVRVRERRAVAVV